MISSVSELFLFQKHFALIDIHCSDMFGIWGGEGWFTLGAISSAPSSWDIINVRTCEPQGHCWHDVRLTPQIVQMTLFLKKLTGTQQLNTTQLSALYCVTRTTGNPVYAHGASNLISQFAGPLFIEACVSPLKFSFFKTTAN